MATSRVNDWEPTDEEEEAVPMTDGGGPSVEEGKDEPWLDSTMSNE